MHVTSKLSCDFYKIIFKNNNLIFIYVYKIFWNWTLNQYVITLWGLLSFLTQNHSLMRHYTKIIYIFQTKKEKIEYKLDDK